MKKTNWAVPMDCDSAIDIFVQRRTGLRRSSEGPLNYNLGYAPNYLYSY